MEHSFLNGNICFYQYHQCPKLKVLGSPSQADWWMEKSTFQIYYLLAKMYAYWV